MSAPVKGTKWKHSKRTEWNGEPKILTVTSVRNVDGKTLVYSVDSLGFKVKGSLAAFELHCAEIVSVPVKADKPKTPSLTQAQCATIYDRAHEAARLAAQACVPVPMHVVERANPFDDHSPVVREYAPVNDGVCGFAYVTVRPANSAMAKYLRTKRHCFNGFHGGLQFSVHDYNQSMTRKAAYASAFASVLHSAGINAYSESRMD